MGNHLFWNRASLDDSGNQDESIFWAVYIDCVRVIVWNSIVDFLSAFDKAEAIENSRTSLCGGSVPDVCDSIWSCI